MDKHLLIRRGAIFSWLAISAMNCLAQGWTLMILSITYLLYTTMLESDFNTRMSTRRVGLEHAFTEVLRWIIFHHSYCRFERKSLGVSINLLYTASLNGKRNSDQQETTGCINLYLHTPCTSIPINVYLFSQTRIGRPGFNPPFDSYSQTSQGIRSLTTTESQIY